MPTGYLLWRCWQIEHGIFDIRNSVMFPDLLFVYLIIPAYSLYTPTLLCLKGNLVGVTTICGILKTNEHYWFFQAPIDSFQSTTLPTWEKTVHSLVPSLPVPQNFQQWQKREKWREKGECLYYVIINKNNKHVIFWTLSLIIVVIPERITGDFIYFFPSVFSGFSTVKYYFNNKSSKK